MQSIQGINDNPPPSVRVRTKTIKKKFVKEFLTNGGNGTKAVQKVHKGLTYDSARKTASNLMKREDVQLMIQEALNETEVSYKYVLENRKEIVDMGMRQIREGKGEKETFVSPKDIHSHLQGIEGVLGLLGNGVSNPSGGSLHIHFDANDHQGLLEKRRELMGFFSGITEDVKPLESVEPTNQPTPQSSSTQVEPEPSK